MSTIDDQLDAEFAPAWRPEPGQKVAGEVVALGERAGYDEKNYPVLTVRTNDGEFAVHAFHAVLRNELAKAHPQIGEVIAIKYLGKTSTRDGKSSYHSYRVAVDRPQPQTLDWSQYSDESLASTTSDVPSDTPAKDADDDNDEIPF
jgi:hypothetical protein